MYAENLSSSRSHENEPLRLTNTAAAVATALYNRRQYHTSACDTPLSALETMWTLAVTEEPATRTMLDMYRELCGLAKVPVLLSRDDIIDTIHTIGTPSGMDPLSLVDSGGALLTLFTKGRWPRRHGPLPSKETMRDASLGRIVKGLDRLIELGHFIELPGDNQTPPLLSPVIY